MSIFSLLLYLFLFLVLLSIILGYQVIIKGKSRNKRILLSLLSGLGTYIFCCFGFIAVVGYDGNGNVFEIAWNISGYIIPFAIIAGIGTYIKEGAYIGLE